MKTLHNKYEVQGNIFSHIAIFKDLLLLLLFTSNVCFKLLHFKL